MIKTILLIVAVILVPPGIVAALLASGLVELLMTWLGLTVLWVILMGWIAMFNG